MEQWYKTYIIKWNPWNSWKLASVIWWKLLASKLKQPNRHVAGAHIHMKEHSCPTYLKRLQKIWNILVVNALLLSVSPIGHFLSINITISIKTILLFSLLSIFNFQTFWWIHPYRVWPMEILRFGFDWIYAWI